MFYHYSPNVNVFFSRIKQHNISSTSSSSVASIYWTPPQFSPGNESTYYQLSALDPFPNTPSLAIVPPYFGLQQLSPPHQTLQQKRQTFSPQMTTIINNTTSPPIFSYTPPISGLLIPTPPIPLPYITLS